MKSQKSHSLKKRKKQFNPIIFEGDVESLHLLFDKGALHEKTRHGTYWSY